LEDLNYLLHREQAELLLAQSASCSSSRASHAGLALGYGKRIAGHRLPYRTPAADGTVLFRAPAVLAA
jgi:hypothetical protein